MRMIEYLKSMQTKVSDYYAKQKTENKLTEIYQLISLENNREGYSENDSEDDLTEEDKERAKQEAKQIAREYFGIEDEQLFLDLKKKRILEKYHSIHLEYITEIREKLEEIKSATSDEDRKKIAKKYFGIEGDKYEELYKKIEKKISSGTVIEYGLICLEYTGQTKKETREKLEEIQKLQSDEDKRKMAREYFFIVGDGEYHKFCQEIKDEISSETINKYESIILAHKEEARKKLKEIKNSQSDEDKRKMAREYFFIVGDDEYKILCEEIKDGVSAKTIDKYLSQRSKYREEVRKKLEEIKNSNLDEDKRKIAKGYFGIKDDEYNAFYEEIKDAISPETFDKYLLQSLEYAGEARKKLKEIKNSQSDEDKRKIVQEYFFIVGDDEYKILCEEIKDGVSAKTIDKYLLQRLKYREEVRKKLEEIKNSNLDEDKRKIAKEYFFIVGDDQYTTFYEEIKNGISPETIDKYSLRYLKYDNIKNKLQLIHDKLVNQLEDCQLKEKVTEEIDNFLKNNKEITIGDLELVKKVYGENSFGSLIDLLTNQIKLKEIEPKIISINNELDSFKKNTKEDYHKNITNFIKNIYACKNTSYLTVVELKKFLELSEDKLPADLLFLHTALKKSYDLEWDVDSHDKENKKLIDDFINSIDQIDNYIQSIIGTEERVKVGEIPLTNPLKATIITQNNSQQI